jgi:hypothetical protein
MVGFDPFTKFYGKSAESLSVQNKQGLWGRQDENKK